MNQSRILDLTSDPPAPPPAPSSSSTAWPGCVSVQAPSTGCTSPASARLRTAAACSSVAAPCAIARSAVRWGASSTVGLDPAAPLDELDPVAVRVAHEADQRAVAADVVRRPLGPDVLLGQLAEGVLQGRHGQRDVVVARAEVIGLDPRVPGQLQAVAVAGEAHEHVDGAVGQVHPPPLLEAERLVEGDRPVDVDDPVAGVDELGHQAVNLPA